MNKMTACQYKRESEMDGDLLPIGLLMKSKIRQKSNNIQQLDNCIEIEVINLFYNTNYLLKYQRVKTFHGYSTSTES